MAILVDRRCFALAGLLVCLVLWHHGFLILFFAEDNIVQAVHSMQIEVEEILCD